MSGEEATGQGAEFSDASSLPDFWGSEDLDGRRLWLMLVEGEGGLITAEVAAVDGAPPPFRPLPSWEWSVTTEDGSGDGHDEAVDRSEGLADSPRAAFAAAEAQVALRLGAQSWTALCEPWLPRDGRERA